ncbi:MAG: hypothetical protein KAX39_02775 [candidate division Zixibacteria bacterium]|nr:hypothetical protein [candidate division Zixibacteria bacterium]
MSKLILLIESSLYLNTKRKYMNLIICALVLTTLAVVLDYKFVSDIVIFLVILLLGFPVLFIVSKVGPVVFPLASTKSYPYGVFELKKCYQRNFGWAIVIAGLLFVMPIWGYKFLITPPSLVVANVEHFEPISARPNTLIITLADVDTLLAMLPSVPSIFTKGLDLKDVIVDPTTIGVPEPAPPEDSAITLGIATIEELRAYLEQTYVSHEALRPDLVLREYQPRSACLGKTIEIVVYLANQGGKVKDLRGTLRSLNHNPRVRIHQRASQFKFGTMVQFDSKSNRSRPYKVIIPEDVVAGDLLTFELRLTGGWKPQEGYLKDLKFDIHVSQCDSGVIIPGLTFKEIYAKWWRDPARKLRDQGFKEYLGSGNTVYFDAMRSSAKIYHNGTYYDIQFDFSEETIVNWTGDMSLLQTLSRIFMRSYCLIYSQSKYCREHQR